MAQLEQKGNEKTRIIYGKHGMSVDKVLGVSMAELKVIAKAIKGQQELALELYDTGIMDAMYLAGLVAMGTKMTKAQIDQWAIGSAGLQMISEYTVPWVAVESPFGRDLANKWIKAKQEHVAASGWCTYSGLVALTPDDALDLTQLADLLDKIGKSIHTAQNRVRHTMNNFVIAIGTYVLPLSRQAIAAARAMGEVTVDMGDTACKVPDAIAQIQKAEATGRLGKKRKTIRC